MVRVAVVVEHNWNRVPGGTGVSTNRLIEALDAHTEVDVVGLAGRHRRGPVLALPAGLELVGPALPGRLLQQLWSRADRPRADRWLGPVDVLHAPGYLLPPTGLPTVVTVHDLAFRHRPDWFTSNGVAFFERFLARVIETDGHVVVPSAHTAADCEAVGLAADRVTVVPWGSDPVTVDPVAVDRWRAELGPGIVLFVGTLEPRKNLAGLVRAVDGLDHARLVVVGPTGWGDVEAPGSAVVLGPRSASEVAELMAAARVLAYPSHLEGFGLPVLEAMAQGTPVVVTAGTAPAEVAGDAGLAVDSTDPVELSQAIDAVVADDVLHARLAAAAPARAAEFTWSAAARAMAGVYERATP